MKNMLLISLLAVMAGGCISAPKRARTAVPEALVEQAYIPGIPEARSWGDAAPPFVSQVMGATPEQIQERFSGVFGRRHRYLAISGGGANGAFGAGLLNGWTARGTRPEFTIVTGTSTGSILAPFAFLGRDYDWVLTELFSLYDTDAVMGRRAVLKAVMKYPFSNKTPLRGILLKYLGDEEVDKIAVAHRTGRRLLVGTFNMDAARPMVWSIGAIAASGQAGSRELIVDVILASAAIPLGFPPVFIDVRAGDHTYQEMHVDGGLGSQVFFYPHGLQWKAVEEKIKPEGTPTIYVIRNSRLRMSWKAVAPTMKDLGGRTISALIRAQGLGDIERIYHLSQRDRVDFHMTYIPDEFTIEAKEPFDVDYMGKLYRLAYESIIEGDPWLKVVD
jgi:hypothetical protein